VSQAFRYRASTVSGDLVEGVVQAVTARDAADELRRQTLVPVSIESATRQAAPIAAGGTGRHESLAVCATPATPA
jgi:type II secretory pathway component PulF